MNKNLVLVLQGALGGVLGASILGLVEALYHLVTAGVPDLLAPFYAWALYGLIGLPFGIAAGLAMILLGRVTEHGEGASALARALGTAFAVSPLLLFILRYLGNKVVYAEQGVPMTGTLVMLGIVAAFFVFEVTAGAWLLRTKLEKLARPVVSIALWVGVAVVLFGLAQLPVGGHGSFASGKGVPAGMEDKPDLLLITVDTLRADYLGAYGHPTVKTPVLDAIAADGIVFEDASAHASWTRSSFASLWTSRLPSAHAADRKASRLSDDLVLLSEHLHDAGMTTGNLANNINVTATFNFDQGYDTFVYEAPDYHFGATESVFSLTFYKVVHKLREKLGGSKEVATFYQPAEVVLHDAKQFIEANDDGRWMLGVHLMEPHDPYFEHPYIDGSGPQEFNGVGFARAEVESPDLDQAEYLKRVYLQEIEHMDRKLADFVDWLKANGHYDDTVIVITADHGEEFGEHGGFWHGTTLYEEQTHVPLIVKLAKNDLAGTRAGWQARLIDVAPTLTKLVGLAPADTWAGKDLLDDLKRDLQDQVEERTAKASARAVVSQFEASVQAGTLDPESQAAYDRAKALLNPGDPCASYAHPLDRTVVAEQDFEGNVLASIELGGFKLITANEGNPRGLQTVELYDIVSDPAEQTNLAKLGSPICGAGGPKRVEDLTAVLGAEVQRARSGAVEAEDVEVDQGETCRLCALGYMSGAQCDEC